MLSNVYFAKDTPEKLMTHLKGIIDQWDSVIKSGGSGLHASWQRNLNMYYANVLQNDESSALQLTGEQGELVKVYVPQARSINRQVITLVTKQRTAFDVIAESTDATTTSDTRVARALIDQVIRDQGLDVCCDRVAEHATLLGAGYWKVAWNPMKGRMTGAAGEQQGENRVPVFQYEGDIEITTPSQLDVIFDFTKEDWREQQWVLVRTIRNRYDLLAELPNMDTELLSIDPAWKTLGSSQIDTLAGLTPDQNANIVVWEFYHKDSPALPGGRTFFFTGDGGSKAAIHDGPNEYGDLPVEQFKAENLFKTGFGYPIFSNLVPLQELLDHSVSVQATNQAAFGVHNILSPDGNDMDIGDMVGGVRLCTYKPMTGVEGGGKPSVMQLLQTPPEVMQFGDLMKSHMQDVSNINGTLRGTPPPGATAGVAYATLSANAIEFLMGFSKNFYLALENTLMRAIRTYATFATEPRIVSLIGDTKQALAKTFTGKDLDPVRRITIRTANPATLTTGMRMEMAKDMIAMGVSDPKLYFQVATTGQIENLYEDELNLSQLIRQENENIKAGKPVVVMPDDDHAEHFKHHLPMTYNVEDRLNAPWMQAFLEHLDDHKAEAAKLGIFLSGTPNGQPPQQPQGMPGEGGPGGGGGGAPAGSPAMPKVGGI